MRESSLCVLSWHQTHKGAVSLVYLHISPVYLVYLGNSNLSGYILYISSLSRYISVYLVSIDVSPSLSR